MCLIEDSRICRWESVVHQSSDNTGGDVVRNVPHCYFSCYFSKLQRSLQQDGIQTSIGPMNILRRLVGVNLVLPRYHKRYSCASV